MTNFIPASKPQTFALFLAARVDVRACNLSKEQASNFISRANSGEREAVRAELGAMAGAIVKTPALAKGKADSKAAIPADSKARESHASLWARAWKAGQEAAAACVPVPMHVVQRANPLDDSSPVVRAYAPVMDGVCGFASVRFAGNTAFGKWAAANRSARPAYNGGLSVSIHEYNQSLQRKEAHAYAMADVLTKAGVRAYGESRMD